MMTRRSFVALAALSLALLATGSALGQSNEDIFFIQRSKNINEVHYEAHVTKDGGLDAKNPVEGYWLNKTQGGTRSSITFMQRIAYGYDVDPAPGGTYTMKLKAFKDRPLTLLRVNGHWRARVTIAGQDAYLTKLYVATDESGVFPKVLYVDIFGEEVASGKPLQEHIVKS